MNTPKKKQYWVGFDLGGTKMMAVVFDSDLQEVARKKRKTRTKSGEEVGLDRIEETLHEALAEASVNLSDVAGIGIGIPGPLNPVDGIVLEATNLGWKNLPLRKQLQEKFGRPVEICNDVDAGVFGEYLRGAGTGCRSLLGMFPGTGIGGGFVYEGRIFHGTRATCMEVGYLQMATEGSAAGVGPVGTLEGLASRLAIAAEAAKAVFRGQAPSLQAIAGTDISKIRSSALRKSIADGDKSIEKIVRRSAEKVGRGIGSLINILAPDRVILGGGLVEAMPELYIDSVKKGLNRNVLPALVDYAEVVVSRLGDLAAAVGAAGLVRQSVTSVSPQESSRSQQLAISPHTALALQAPTPANESGPAAEQVVSPDSEDVQS